MNLLKVLNVLNVLSLVIANFVNRWKLMSMVVARGCDWSGRCVLCGC